MEHRRQPESPYQRSARMKFPYHTRRGDGPFALIDERRGTLELFQFELFAVDALSKANPLTRLVRLQPDYGRASSNAVLRTTAETVEFRK